MASVWSRSIAIRTLLVTCALSSKRVENCFTKGKLLSSTFPVAPLVILYTVVPAFKSKWKIPQCYHSNIFLWYCSCLCTRWFLVLSQWIGNSKVCRTIHDESYWAVLSCGTVYYAWHNMVVLTFESADKILNCNHSNESYWVVFPSGTVYYATQGGSHFWVCG